jgi:hypothetical protein
MNLRVERDLSRCAFNEITSSDHLSVVVGPLASICVIKGCDWLASWLRGKENSAEQSVEASSFCYSKVESAEEVKVQTIQSQCHFYPRITQIRHNFSSTPSVARKFLNSPPKPKIFLSFLFPDLHRASWPVI